MEWKEVRLGDIVSIKSGLAYKGAFIGKGENILLGMGCVSFKDKFLFSGARPYEADCDDKYCVEPGDIVLATRQQSDNLPILAMPAIIPPSLKAPKIIYGTNLYKVENHSEVTNDFLFWQLKTPNYIDYISSVKTGSVVRMVTKKNVEDYVFRCPPKEVRDRISKLLWGLDRKIELNNKINADLEEMAQAIFKNWFVDFEPFKDGKFVDSELGMIPEGWKVGTLGELCNFKRGKNLLTKNAIDEGVPVVAGGLEPSCYHNVANTGAPVITVSGSGANAGFMRMYHVPVWASDCSFIDISCENFYFVYCFLKVNSKLLKHAQTGAVQPHVKPSDIHDFELVIPDKKSIYDFQDKVKPFFDKIASIQKENSRLSLLRDTLLPRLMSGELEVPE